MIKTDYAVLGIGAPLLDHIIPVPEEFLSQVPGSKGGMELVSSSQFDQIIQNCGERSNPIPAGCTANIIKGLALMGHPCKFVGKAGVDEASQFFKRYFEEIGVTSNLIPCKTSTAQAACLVTPDGERTIRTYIGAAGKIKAKHINESFFKSIRHVHIEGYSIYYGDLMDKVIDLAKENKVTISMDLGSFETVKLFKERFQHVLSHGVDFLFANEKESEALVGADAQAACQILGQLCNVVVITEGAKGYWVKDRQLQSPVHGDAHPVEQVVDTTGAGDSFACGFLHGFLEDLPILECARKGAFAASKAIQIQGTAMSKETWLQIKDF